MRPVLTLFIVLVYILLTGFLEFRLVSRIVLADLMLVVLMLTAMPQILYSSRMVLPNIHVAALPMLAVFMIGAIFARYPNVAAFELLVMFFGFLGSIFLVNMLVRLSEVWIERLFAWYVLVLGGVAFVCLLDFFVIPGLIPNRNLGGLVGTFRNTGQAGSFFGVHVALSIALLISNVIPRRPIYLLAILLLVLALVFTLKRASSIAVVVGLLLLVVQMLFSTSARDKKRAVGFLVSGAIGGGVGYALFQWGLQNTKGLAWRAGSKYSSSTLGDFANGFFAENLQSTIEAFSDRPLLGVGLGNVYGVYQSHEIHSTYLGIVAYGGILGLLSYSVFMFVFLRTIILGARHRIENKWSAFLYTLFPLVLGQMVGWGYTYHLRKREFWILVVFVLLARYLSERLRSQDRSVGPFGKN